MQAGQDEAARFFLLTPSTPLQQKTLELPGVNPNL
jgi:hypothetical protein